MRRLLLTLLAATIPIAIGADARAQVRVRTEIVRPPSAIIEKDIAAPLSDPATLGQALAAPETRARGPMCPEIVADVARLPPAVARTRDRILAAARTGRLDMVLGVMQANETMPIFSLGDDKEPMLYWRSNYPDSGGVEVLATLIGVLETSFVHVDEGTPQEMYLWPYFAREPLKALTPEQKVELFRLVTGADYKAMLDDGAYNFYRVGIGADGAWRFFVAGD